MHRPGSDALTDPTKGESMALVQPQLIRSVADRAKLGEAEAGRALSALEEILLQEGLGAVTRRLSGLVQSALGIDLSQIASASRHDQPRAIAAKSVSAEPEFETTKASRRSPRQRVAA
jgi:hypothetical protein